MEKETILEELKFKLGLLHNKTTLDDIKCATFNLSYTTETTMGDSFHVLDKIFLPVLRTKDQEDVFFGKLDSVNSYFDDDAMWDCSGTVWMKDGSWYELVLPSEWANCITFSLHYPPDIPSELLNF